MTPAVSWSGLQLGIAASRTPLRARFARSTIESLSAYYTAKTGHLVANLAANTGPLGALIEASAVTV
jgi:hypothetical protein